MFLFVLFGACTDVRADVITNFATKLDWSKAVGTSTDLNFEGLVPDFTTTNPFTGDYQLSDVIFESDTGVSKSEFVIVGKGFYYANTSVLSAQFSTNNLEGLRIVLPKPVIGIAMNLGNFERSQVTFTTDNGGKLTVSEPAYPGLGFFGLKFSKPTTTLLITEPSDPFGMEVLNLANLSYAYPEPVPEPIGVAAFILTGGGSLWLLWRRSQAIRP